MGSEPHYEIERRPGRWVVVVDYSGPKRDLGRAIQPLAEWVMRWDASRAHAITVAYARRPESAAPPGASVDAQLFVEVADADVDGVALEESALPDGLRLERWPAMRVATDRYLGPLDGLTPALLRWLRGMDGEHELTPGYFERIVRRGRSAADPGWEIEMGVELAGPSG